MKDWSYIVREPRRTELLRRFGVSEPAIRLGLDGQLPHPVFKFYCEVPHMSPDDQAATGPLVVGLYEGPGDVCHGVRHTPSGLEFVRFSSEEPERIRVMGRNEKAVWVELFSDLLTSEDFSGDELIEAADAVGFRALPEVIQYYADESDEPLDAFVARLSDS